MTTRGDRGPGDGVDLARPRAAAHHGDRLLDRASGEPGREAVDVGGGGAGRHDRLVLLQHDRAGDRARGIEADQDVERLAGVADRADDGAGRQGEPRGLLAAEGAPVGRRTRYRREPIGAGNDATQEIGAGLGGSGRERRGPRDHGQQRTPASLALPERSGARLRRKRPCGLDRDQGGSSGLA